jgi:hypothetical protein
VYVSDIKKLAQWYNILHKAGYVTPESFVKAEPETDESAPSDSTDTEKKTEKAAPKKAAAKTDKPAAPKVKASTGAKAATKSTHRKMG